MLKDIKPVAVKLKQFLSIIQKKEKRRSFAVYLSLSGCSHVDSLFNSEEKKSDIVLTSATHASHVHDITDLVKMAVLMAVFL